MRAKLYLLGAVLGAAPGLLPCAPTPPAPPVQGLSQPAPGGGPQRRGAVPRTLQPLAPLPLEPLPLEPLPLAPPRSGPRGRPALQAGPEGRPKHPCELVTALRVPCDGSQAACEYTYWQCPRSVRPLRA